MHLLINVALVVFHVFQGDLKGFILPVETNENLGLG